jgi:phospholipid-binding lipoprotein MlaA
MLDMGIRMPAVERRCVQPATLAILALSLSGCATTGAPDPADPLQPMNRGVYSFNDTLDRAALKPVAVAYHDHTPSWFQTGVGNFFENLTYPGTALNNLLQGKVVAAGQDTLRFVINTTLGWGGVLDVASGAGLPQHEEDLGQTLGKWGVPAGPYLMVPFLGPSTLRDLPSRVADTLLEPLYWFDPGNARWVSLGLSLVDTRARLLPLDQTLDGVYDKYAFIRNGYLQSRQYDVYDGSPPEEPIDEELLDDSGADDGAGTTPPQP